MSHELGIDVNLRAGRPRGGDQAETQELGAGEDHSASAQLSPHDVVGCRRLNEDERAYLPQDSSLACAHIHPAVEDCLDRRVDIVWGRRSIGHAEAENSLAAPQG